MSNLDVAISQMIDLWRTEGVTLRQPCTARSIAAAETRLNRSIPDAMKRLYLSVDGMAPEGGNYPISSRHIRIWPLEEVQVATSGYAGPYDGGLLFADYLLGSHEYCLADPDAVVLAAHGESWIVAANLSAFLNGYVVDDPVVFGGKAKTE